MKTLAVTSQPAIEPVTLNEVKAFLKIDTSDQDSYLTGLIVAVRQVIENYLRRALITQTLRLTLDNPFAYELTLWMPPIQSITSIKTYDDLNNATTIDSNDYFLRDDFLYLKQSFEWTSDIRPLSGYEIIYVAGYGSASDIPQAIKNGILEQIKSVYECGSDSLSYKSIVFLASYRILRVE